MATFLAEYERKARKKHNCVWCNEYILPGEKYLDRRYVMDGDLVWDKVHPECQEAMHKSDLYDDCFDPHEQIRGKTLEESICIRDTR